jgi:23S rRNA (cytidine1920-2'-O)/16S rRNA (cytidine1409-2'-O)-methyltransferase
VNAAALDSPIMKSKSAHERPSDHSGKKATKPGKSRLDVLMVERNLAPSREKAQALILAGQVRVNGQKSEKPGTSVAMDVQLEIIGEVSRYASRAGMKLEGALEEFSVTPQRKICLDIGSSTGGFTDCLLQHGAMKVYAVDVTTNQIDWKLRQDSRVVLVEANARYLRAEDIPQKAELVTMDVSFISVVKVLPAVVPLAAPHADFLILVKPQFELEKREIGKGGIVRDAALHQKAVDRVVLAATEAGLEVSGVRPSRVQGAEGNQEFFLHARRHG